jgi:hypothetical protein
MIFFSSVSRDGLPWMYRRTPQMKVSYLSLSPENLGGGVTRDLTVEWGADGVVKLDMVRGSKVIDGSSGVRCRVSIVGGGFDDKGNGDIGQVLCARARATVSVKRSVSSVSYSLPDWLLYGSRVETVWSRE